MEKFLAQASKSEAERGPATGRREFIEKLPKAELHLHLEGSITSDRFQALARKYSTEYESWDADALRNRLFRYADFAAFLETFKVVCQHLREPEDYAGLVCDLGEYFIRNNIRYAEVIVTPAIPWRFDRDGEAVLQSVLDAADRQRKESGVEIRWILDCVRQFGVEPAQRTAELADAYRERGVVGVGLGGDESSLPASELAETFAWVKAHALHVHVHAGETGGPEQIWDALQILGANRIGHGIQAARDPKLMDYLKKHAIGLDVCLSSNQATGAWRPMAKNPFWLLYQRGVPVTINTDDPGLFETELADEYELAAKLFQFTTADLSQIALQSVHCSFLPHWEKMQLMQVLQDEIASLG